MNNDGGGHVVFLGLGSNVGDRGGHLQRALVDLEKWGVKIVRASSLYESEPVDYVDQPWFYNMAVLVETAFSAEELLKVIHAIELALGRQRNVRFGPRTIDIDILFYDRAVMDFPELQIPHPRLADRKFVLLPMVEIAGGFVDPLSGKKITELLMETGDKSVVRLLV